MPIKCDTCNSPVINDDKKSKTHYFYCPVCKVGVSVHRGDKAKDSGDNKDCVGKK